ncbi:hypothetical protein [Hoeflea sp.]|uniref:hypothetical protein n=1 Tax=Hoeflea sp. TaxID=1940281 RepID=UPI0019C21F03|nr:hypothetical protein [Hoeflea sp.]MBC7280931.1 hypothetical protein [Hoeflea sp.]
MMDAILTYSLVALAALYVLRKLILPATVRRRISHGLSGRTTPCISDQQAGQCPAGCSGCTLGMPRKRN